MFNSVQQSITQNAVKIISGEWRHCLEEMSARKNYYRVEHGVYLILIYVLEKETEQRKAYVFEVSLRKWLHHTLQPPAQDINEKENDRGNYKSR